MGKPISQSEKLDIFLALATFYEFKLSENFENATPESQLGLAIKKLSALGKSEFQELKDRAKRFESLSTEQQKNWQLFWLEKLRNRGQTQRLDESIHPENLVNILKDEPKIIQQMIFNNLPDELAQGVEKLIPEIKAFDDRSSIRLPIERIGDIVREKFLSNFVAFEDVYKPNAIDALTFEQLEKFIWKLGIRETAISCRGIKTKESLAVFLKPFNEEITKEIASNIRELENIEPKRVMLAVTIANEVFKNETDSSNWINSLGSMILALTYSFRDDVSKLFIVQKFPIDQAKQLFEYIQISETEKLIGLTELGEEIINLAKECKEVRN